MMTLAMLGILFFLFGSCSNNGRKENNYTNNAQNQITIVESVGDNNTAFTKDGSTIIYSNDSAGNYIIYYAKFDDNTGKYGYDRIKERIVQVEIDSTLNTIKSIISAYGGAFCETDDDFGYNIYCYDEMMKSHRIEHVPAICEPVSPECTGKEYEVKKIISLLNVACKIAYSIKEQNAEGWHKVVEALQPSLDIFNYEAIMCDTIYDTLAKNHIRRICSTKESLTRHYLMLLDKKNNESTP